MTLTATVTGFFLLLLSVEVIQGQHSSGVKCSPPAVCALKGSSVELNCSYTDPFTGTNTFKRMYWFTEEQDGTPVDLRTDPQYEGRVSFTGAPGHVTLRITDLRESDSAVYNIMVEAEEPGVLFTIDPGVYFSVTDLQVQVRRDQYGNEPVLICENSCRWTSLSYIWYKNGEAVHTESYHYPEDFDYGDNISCAVKGHEDFPSPPFLIQDQVSWEVKCTADICAVKGSTVDLTCSYYDVSTRRGLINRVKEMYWFTKDQDGEPVIPWTDPQYKGRVSVMGVPGRITLRITDLRESNSDVYYFRLETEQPGGIYTSDPGVSLSVTDPDLQVQVRRPDPHGQVYLMCQSSCLLPQHSSYIWYKSGEEIQSETSSSYNLKDFTREESYSCALEGHKDSSSYFVCVLGSSCNRVLHTERKICAPKGSSVNISSNYNSYENITSKFWFSPALSLHWKNPILPEDLNEDSQFADRVQVFETERGRSTLRITDLRESDSAEYRFKFKTQSFEWTSSLPATTLTVAALQVRVTRILVNQSSTYADLECHSSCIPARGFSFTWFRNGETNSSWPETTFYKGWISLEEEISCAFRGHEQFPSPPVYAPKVPSVLVTSSGEILENSSVTLTCSSDANPEANYAWYKKNGDQDVQPLSNTSQLVFSSFQSSDSGEYYCVAENVLGKRTSKLLFVDMKYKSTMVINAIRLALMAVIPIPLLLFSLWMSHCRKKTTLSSTPEPNEPEGTAEVREILGHTYNHLML
ncbi:B-cell receptor CD22-like [Notolabrus celidotus]|uniref:B-cell receptor CD22-like n=1 Tax=Notolabrus celidotus TaxID=1203425 RepID=UPI00148FE91B|nr:B-cell receptor CD22-like [Notolabrus celidotus]